MAHERTRWWNYTSTTGFVTVEAALGTTGHYDSLMQEDYTELLGQAIDRVESSLFAAALVDLEVSQQLAGPIEKIEGAADIVDTISGWETFIDQHPDESLLALTGSEVALMSAKGTRFQPNGGGQIVVEAPLQDSALMHSGKLRAVQRSMEGHEVEDSYEIVVIKLRDVLLGVASPAGTTLSPMIAGREKIASLFGELAARESLDGFSESRLRSIPYAIWLIRDRSPELAADLEVIANKYGLRQGWRRQCQDQIGANIAHTLIAMQQGISEPVSEATEADFLAESRKLLGREIKVLGIGKEAVKAQALEQCKRLGFTPGRSQLQKAFSIVTAGSFENTE